MLHGLLNFFLNFHDFWTISIPAECLWRGFLIFMYCDLWTIGTWGHPSPLRHADVLWMVRELVLTLVTLFPCRNQKLLCCTAKYHQDYRFAMFINQGWEKRTLLHLPLLKIVFCCIVVWIQPYNSGFSKFPKLVDPLAVLSVRYLETNYVVIQP